MYPIPFTLSNLLTLPPLLLLQSVLINLQKEFMPNASNDTAVQKTKKQKQAIEVTVSRKDSVDGGSNNNKENVNQTNVLTDNDESTAMDSTASLNQRPVRIRRTKLDNLVSSMQRFL